MESIKEKLEKSKSYLKPYLPTLFFGVSGALLVLALLGTLNLAKIYKSRPIIRIVEAKEVQEIPKTTEKLPQNDVLPATSGAFVASKTGKSYYFPWCATAKRIKEANRVWFADKASAEAAGYKPAGNCHGLK